MPITTGSVGSQFKLFKMPGGEWHVQNLGPAYDLLAYVQDATADDLLALAVLADSIHRSNNNGLRTRISAVIPYLPGARQDRAPRGEALSCKVYADLINSCKLDRVICFDPHSDVMPALINNCVVVPVEAILKFLFKDHKGSEYQIDGIIAPDIGASKKAWKVAQCLDVPMYQAYKHRDMKTGKLSGFSCETLPENGQHLLVVDDICDGGGTFIGLAQHIKSLPENQNIGLSLWVSHGIFSKGIDELLKHYKGIYTTDSRSEACKLDDDYEARADDGYHNVVRLFELLKNER